MQQDTSCLRAEINLKAAAENLVKIKTLTTRNTGIFAVVKADAYAHGAQKIGGTLLASGADYLCVATPAEGIELRTSGISGPVLVLNPAAPFEAEAIARYGLTPALGDVQTAGYLSVSAKKFKRTIKVHAEIDTGMGRFGFLPEHAVQGIKKISEMEGIKLEGVFTHFSCANEKSRLFTESQFKKFKDLLDLLETGGVKFKYKHAANSAGLLNFSQSSFNAVRPGLLLYGISPVKGKPFPGKPVLTLKTAVTHIRKVPQNTPVSYGGTYRTSRPSVIATIPAGYADGYDRRLSNKARVLIKGIKAPVVGRICMDRFLVDITGIEAKPGEEVILIGRQGDKKITAEELAEAAGMIPHEFICRLGKRIKRIYI